MKLTQLTAALITITGTCTASEGRITLNEHLRRHLEVDYDVDANTDPNRMLMYDSCTQRGCDFFGSAATALLMKCGEF